MAVGVPSGLQRPRDFLSTPWVDTPAEPSFSIQGCLTLQRQDQGQEQQEVRALATLSLGEAKHCEATHWLRLNNANALLVVITKWRHWLYGTSDHDLIYLLSAIVF